MLAKFKKLKINQKLSANRFWGTLIVIALLIVLVTIGNFVHVKNEVSVEFSKKDMSKEYSGNSNYSSESSNDSDITILMQKVSKLKASQEYLKTKNSFTNKEDLPSVPPIISKGGIAVANSPVTVDNVIDNISTQSSQQLDPHHQQEMQDYYNALKSAGKIQLSAISFSDKEKQSNETKLTQNNIIASNKLNSSNAISHAERADENDNLTNKKSKGTYVLYTGSYIPATLDSELNSDIKGQVRALVRSDVFDSVTHRNLLIPAGSRLIGNYDNNISYGQNRLLVAWTKLYYPDGQFIDLKAQPATDMGGANGLQDKVDNHMWQIWSSAFLVGTITAAMQYSQNNINNSGTNNPTIGQTMASSLGQQLGQTGLQIVQKGVNIPPTIIIRRGYMFNIQTINDIVLTPITG